MTNEQIEELHQLMRRLREAPDNLVVSVTARAIYQFVREQEREAQLDEHKILAALDDEGKKQRYLALAREGR